ncbi:hypothetical protein ACCD06_29730 [Azospirillum sp. CT11-132]|uniref:hypothetical protein n=1 Tax=Azospirillum sp. CT11-132 TaxID=3396317 RepID=UPI0039A5A2F7
MLTAITTVVIYYFQTDLPTWLPAHPIESSHDAREIAEALSTPPTHLSSVMRFNLYHWQTLIAGFFAFFGGLSALVAAYMGAQALREQTASSQRLAQREIIRQRGIRNHDRNQKERQFAAAIYCEISDLVNSMKAAHNGGNIAIIEGEISCRAFIDNVKTQEEIHPIFDAIRADIGIMPVNISTNVIRFYSKERWMVRRILEIKSDASRSLVTGPRIIELANEMVYRIGEVLESGDITLSALEAKFHLESETSVQQVA